MLFSCLEHSTHGYWVLYGYWVGKYREYGTRYLPLEGYRATVSRYARTRSNQSVSWSMLLFRESPSNGTHFGPIDVPDGVSVCRIINPFSGNLLDVIV